MNTTNVKVLVFTYFISASALIVLFLSIIKCVFLYRVK
jgi:hypothetical protein